MLRFCLHIIFSLILTAVAFPVSPVVSAEVPTAGRMVDSINARDMDVREVIELIARKSGLNIVVGSAVEGRITIFLNNVDALEALRMVLDSGGLAFALEDNVVRVMTALEYKARYGQPFGQDRSSRVIRLNYMPVQDMALLLNEVKSEQGRVAVSEASRSIILTDVPERLQAMEKIIREMDVQVVTGEFPLHFVKAQDILESVQSLATRVGLVECDMAKNRLIVTDTPPALERIRRAVERLDAQGQPLVLQAKLVHIALNEEHLGGVDWSGILEDFRNIHLRGNYEFLDGESQKRVLSLGLIADEDFATLLDALGTVGMVREFPLSDVVLEHSDRARISVHFDEPALDLVRVSGDYPVSLSSGPAVLDFELQTEADLKRNILTRIVPAEQARDRIPLSRASAGSIDVPPGNTLVLGGLIATEKIATIRKIPLMGDLPLLGFAFRFRNSSVRREEFVIFLSPRVPASAEQQNTVVPPPMGSAAAAEVSP